MTECHLTRDQYLELEKIGHYAVAKIKEAVLAVTGP